jgi:hypothetical protein
MLKDVLMERKRNKKIPLPLKPSVGKVSQEGDDVVGFDVTLLFYLADTL